MAKSFLLSILGVAVLIGVFVGSGLLGQNIMGDDAKRRTCTVVEKMSEINPHIGEEAINYCWNAEAKPDFWAAAWLLSFGVIIALGVIFLISYAVNEIRRDNARVKNNYKEVKWGLWS